MRLDRGSRADAPGVGSFAAAARRATSASTSPGLLSPCCDPLLQRDLLAFHRHQPEVSGVDLVVTTTLESVRRDDGSPPFVVGAPLEPTAGDLGAAFVITESLLEHFARQLAEGPTDPEAMRYARWAAERLGVGDGRRSDRAWSRQLATGIWSRSRFAGGMPEAIALVADFERQLARRRNGRRP